jgi:hypothetical protein
MLDKPRAPYDFNRVTRLDPQSNGRNYGGEKELLDIMHFVAPLPKGPPGIPKLGAVVTVRWWMSRRSDGASPVYAAIWARSRDGAVYLAGHGRATGYGYDKRSTALEEAMQSAGVRLQASFGGYGDTAAQHAVIALARRLGWKAGAIV